jgi:hypothetical protein
MIDANTVIRTALLANSPLVALTGQRIWAARNLPPAGYTPSVGGALGFRIRGGSTLYHGGLQYPSVQFKCWGATEIVAGNVYEALYDALLVPSLGIRSAVIEVLGQPAEEENGWPFVLVFYTIWLKV